MGKTNIFNIQTKWLIFKIDFREKPQDDFHDIFLQIITSNTHIYNAKLHRDSIVVAYGEPVQFRTFVHTPHRSSNDAVTEFWIVVLDPPSSHEIFHLSQYSTYR